MTNFTIIDLETTGVNPQLDRIIEVGAIKIIDGKLEEELSFLINPKRNLSNEIKAITGIKDEDLVDAPKFEEVIDDLEDFLDDLPIIAHNKEFDESFLRKEGVEKELHDTLELSCLLLPLERKHTQEFLLEKHCNFNYEGHRALEDVKALHQLIVFLEKRAAEMDSRLKEELKRELEDINWGFKSFLDKDSSDSDSYLTEKGERKNFYPVAKKDNLSGMAMAHLLSFLFYTETGNLNEMSRWVRRRYKEFFKDVKIEKCQETPFFNKNERLF